MRAIVAGIGAQARLYRLECPQEEARRRIAARNRAENRSLIITPATYDALKGRFEPLSDDEAFVEAAVQPQA